MEYPFSLSNRTAASQAGARTRVLLADRPAGLDRLRRLLDAIPDVEIVASASSGVEARRAATATGHDLLIVNVDLPDWSESELAATAQAEDVVFVSQSPDFAAEAFSLNAVDYLIAPVGFDRLRQAIDRACRGRLARMALSAERSSRPGDAAKREGFWVKTGSGAVFVPIDTISRIEAHGEYVLLHTDQRAHMARLRMCDVELRVEGSGLVRVHRSSFVQLAQIVEFQRDGNRLVEVLLRCGTRLRVSAKYAQLLRDRLRASPF